MTKTISRALQLSAAGLGAMLLAGCSMGGLMGGGNAAQTQNLQNATPTAAAVAQAQTNALPAIATQCPPIKVRPGSEAMFYYGSGKTGDARALQYQGVIDETSRNCTVSNGLITVNMGVVGRVLLGPQGKQSTVNAPIRFAVERDGQAIFSEKYTLPVALVPYLGGEEITIWVGFDTRG
jgi:hypothetical protein